MKMLSEDTLEYETYLVMKMLSEDTLEYETYLVMKMVSEDTLEYETSLVMKMVLQDTLELGKKIDEHALPATAKRCTLVTTNDRRANIDHHR